MGFLINPYWFVAATPGEEYVNSYSNDFDGVDDVVATVVVVVGVVEVVEIFGTLA